MSDREFTKCQTMLAKHAASLVDKATGAKQKHDTEVNGRIARHLAAYGDSTADEARMRRIVDRLVAHFEPQEYRRILIDEAAEEVLSFENTAGFKCPNKANVNRGFKRNLERYENRLEEIENAVEERLGLEDIGPKEGLVVMLFYASGYAENIHINRLGAIGGDIHFGPVENREYFRVLKVKAGDYRWHSIWNKGWRGGRTVLHMKSRKLDFTVEAGKLNYTGVFMFSNRVYPYWRADIRDRSSVVLSLLEDRYPELLNKVEFANAVDPNDRFIEFYLREKMSVEQENDGA